MIIEKTQISEAVREAQKTLRYRYNYNRWIYDTVRIYIGERILEVGCGMGNITQFMLFNELVFGIDISDDFLSVVNERYGKLNNFRSLNFDIEKDDIIQLTGNKFDTVVCLNVLEHIKDDDAALKNMYEVLEKDGRLILFVPAYQWLFNSLDRNLGHFRRYNKKELIPKLKKAGFSIERTFHMNMIGVFGWFLSGNILRRYHLPARQTLIFDKLVPLFIAFELLFKPLFGLSLICICRKN